MEEMKEKKFDAREFWKAFKKLTDDQVEKVDVMVRGTAMFNNATKQFYHKPTAVV